VEKGQMLEKLADTFGEDSQEFKKMLGNLKSADKVLESQFSEIGKAARGDVPALAAFDAKVEEIAKRDKIDKPHAVGKAMEEAPELYLDYERSQRQAVARA
jgi:HPt (histidine-containing phosphotransfer) domain-containing protein